MYLTKVIPARRKTVYFKWCNKDYMKMSPRYREIRESLLGRRKGTLTSCYWCGHKFEDEEMMSLASPIKDSNKVLCHDCAGLLMSSRSIEES